MTQRIVTKIGDVFSVTLDNGNLRFFQYIANDLTQLNSSVIRVFKKEYPAEYEIDVDDIVADDVEFYAHTVLKFGIKAGVWRKVGKSQNVGNTENIMFRMYISEAADHRERIWEAWFLNKEPFIIGKLSKYYRENSNIGLVFYYKNVTERIKNGIYPGSMFSFEEN